MCMLRDRGNRINAPISIFRFCCKLLRTLRRTLRQTLAATAAVASRSLLLPVSIHLSSVTLGGTEAACEYLSENVALVSTTLRLLPRLPCPALSLASVAEPFLL